MNKYWIFLFIIFLSCSGKREIKDKTIIPVAEVVGTGEILNLSDYAKSVKYIPLETNDLVLITNIGSIRKLESAYVVIDSRPGLTSRCLLFDENGTFIKSVGQQGQGPEEYTTIRSVDVNPKVNRVLLDHDQKCIEYDSDGNLKKIIEVPICPDKVFRWGTAQISDSVYLSPLVSPLHRLYKAILFRSDNHTIKLYPNYFGQEKMGIDKGSWGTLDGRIYRYKEQIRYWRDWDDTIFTFNEKQDVQVAFRFDFGKYKAPMEWLSSFRKDYDQIHYVFPQTAIMESDQYLFLQFHCGRNAPEKYEYELGGIGQGVRMKRKLVNVTVYGVFDKQTGKLILLNQPVKHKLGFRNDLDDGPVFWPKYISSKEEMITSCSADEFLTAYTQLSNPSSELKAVAGKLKSDDNPVLMVVTLK